MRLDTAIGKHPGGGVPPVTGVVILAMAEAPEVPVTLGDADHGPVVVILAGPKPRRPAGSTVALAAAVLPGRGEVPSGA